MKESLRLADEAEPASLTICEAALAMLALLRAECHPVDVDSWCCGGRSASGSCRLCNDRGDDAGPAWPGSGSKPQHQGTGHRCHVHQRVRDVGVPPRPDHGDNGPGEVQNQADPGHDADDRNKQADQQARCPRCLGSAETGPSRLGNAIIGQGLHDPLGAEKYRNGREAHPGGGQNGDDDVCCGHQILHWACASTGVLRPGSFPSHSQ